jgi:hypothetical protein
MNDIALTLPADHIRHKPLPGAGSLFAALRSTFIYLAFASSVAFTLAVVFGIVT